jgi:hypothetical protein
MYSIRSSEGLGEDVDLEPLAASICDAALSTAERVVSVRRLESADSDERLALLARLAADSALAPDVAAEVGRAFARALIASGRLEHEPLAYLCDPAYLAFDEEVAKYQRGQGSR